jgi:hypothetical protein
VKSCTLMLTDFHGRYTERSVGNRTVCGEGRGSVDWLGIRTAWGKIHGEDNMRTSSVDGEV